MGEDRLRTVAKWFKEELDKNGYSFQDAIARAASQVGFGSMTYWEPWIPELPVEVQGAHTRIDFIFTNPSGSVYLVCECKRSNPALSNWCFAQTWFKSSNSLFGKVYAESITDVGQGVLRSQIKEFASAENLYQIAVEVKSEQKGDSESDGRGQIEKAATQVCRHLNGLVNFLYTHTVLMRGRQQAAFVPVILTTANLWTTEIDLSSADIQSGKLNLEELPVHEAESLWYQYHQSPGLKHSCPVNYTAEKIDDILFYESVRPIAVVTPRGLERFLQSRMWR
ncbi:MAG: hypothetical protein AABZ34_18600 [Nitrospirota bacterium]